MNSDQIKELKQQHVITKLIFDAEYRSEVTGFLQIQDFVSEDHRKVYAAILKKIGQNKPLDPLELMEDTGVVLPLNPGILEPEIDYKLVAKRLSRDGNRYRIKILLGKFVDDSDSPDFKFEDEYTELLKEINKPIEEGYGGYVGMDSVSDFLDKVNRQNNQVVGKTGVSKLDSLLEGLERGHIYSFVAAPGVGKSMMAIQIMHETMKQGSGVMYVSNEMSNTELVARFLARETKMSNLTIRRNNVERPMMKELTIEQDKLANLMDKTKSVVLDRAHDFDKTLKAIRYYVIKNNINVVIIDHLHNFKGSADIYERVSKMAHALQELAQELNIALVIFAQIALENQKQNIENLTAKGAGDVQEVSNVLVALKRKKTRTSVTSMAKEDDPNYMHIVVSKNRDGRTGNTGAWVMFPSMVINQDEDAR
jgi:replicative DNA helicase